MKAVGVVSFVAFVGTVWLANWLVQSQGLVPVGFGLEAPAGVYAAGLALVLRDVVQRTLGRVAVVAAILLGCLLAYELGDAFTVPGGLVTLALASAVAFLVSEFADMAVYTPLQERGFLGAVLASNVVGAAVDSALFLWLAFGGTALFWGQVVGKLWMSVLAFPALFLTRDLFEGR